MKNCKTSCDNPDLRDGASQRQRYLNALDPGNMPVDGHSLEDLLVFTKKLAGQIRFFDTGDIDTPDDIEQNVFSSDAKSWKSFFESDMAVIAAEMAVTNLSALQKSQTENRADFEDKPNIANFGHLFDALLGIARRINKWRNRLHPDTPLKAEIDLLIRSSLQSHLLKCLEYDKGLMIVNQGESLNLDFWPLDTEDIWDLPANAILDDSIYVGVNLEQKLIHAAGFVEDAFNAFYQGIKNLTNRADYYLEQSLEQYPTHQPHIALFISFLQLFKLAQQQLNSLTGKHLDFYYREVLRLNEKPAQPDSVNLIFELAKEASEYLIPQNAELSAGKDEFKKELIYKTDRELVVNRAKVAALKTIFIDAEVRAGGSTLLKNFYANPVAKSADGLGAPFATPDSKWHTFGGWPAPADRVFDPDICKKATFIEKTPANKGEIGFAIASPDFLLAGGNRKITIQLGSEIINKLKDNIRSIRLSSEKGWLNVNLKQGVSIQPTSDIFSDDFESGFELFEDSLHIGLTVGEPAIIPFDPALHTGRAYQTLNPLLEILVNPENLDPELFLLGENAMLVQVIVGSLVNETSSGGFDSTASTHTIDGVQDLLLQNNDGVIDPSQSIQPFTLYPHNGNSFYVSNKEFANKEVEALKVQVEWSRPEGPSLNTSVSVLGLEKIGVWKNIRTSAPFNSVTNMDLLEEDITFNILSWFSPFVLLPNVNFIRPVIAFPLNQGITAVARPQLSLAKAIINNTRGEEKSPWTIKSKRGFIRYSLTEPEDSRAFEPDRQFQIKSIALAYRTKERPLAARIDELFHIYPFGELETFPTSNDTVINELEDATGHLFVPTTIKEQVLGQDTVKWHLLPQFRYGNPAIVEAPNQYNQEVIQQGNLYIGIENLKPPQNLSLLFHFAEGSALDEDSDPPFVHWSYLSNNEWKPLPDDYILSDGTYGFQTTGVILLDIPPDATNNNTIITPGLHWLCASVSEGVERLPMLVDVIAQAGTATFFDSGNDPAHYLNPLPANSIAKLAVKVAEIKKVEQPFASFGGKPQHKGREFYTFAAERLRHKARAITPWDYEHLVLEQFPSIYKVKCIAHTDPECLCRHTQDATPEACCGPQTAPGHVLVVPIANLRNRNAVNKLQPKTSRRLLIEIGKYLSKRTSPFVHVHVKNPRYEEILTRFKVKFYSGVDKGYHLRKLNEDLVKYLTPWAFDDFAQVVFGGRVYASEVINFIEERPYVDFITDFELFHCKENCCPEKPASTPAPNVPMDWDKVSNCTDIIAAVEGQVKTSETLVEATKANVILVSAPQHLISLCVELAKNDPCKNK